MRVERSALVLLGSACALAVALACSAEPAPAATPADASQDHADASEPADAGPADAAAAARDAGPDASQPGPDAALPGPDAGLACTFNSDCPSAERCECDEATGCYCKPGARGTGKSGVDTCTTGNDCESSLCVEGNGGTYYCSGPCSGASDCGPNLPKCSYIQLIGNICIRG